MPAFIAATFTRHGMDAAEKNAEAEDKLKEKKEADRNAKQD